MSQTKSESKIYIRCHCGLNWLQSAIAKQNYGFTIEDGAKIRCDGQHLLDVDLNSEVHQNFIEAYYKKS